MCVLLRPLRCVADRAALMRSSDARCCALTRELQAALTFATLALPPACTVLLLRVKTALI